MPRVPARAPAVSVHEGFRPQKGLIHRINSFARPRKAVPTCQPTWLPA
jgi:hypothetical protein